MCNCNSPKLSKRATISTPSTVTQNCVMALSAIKSIRTQIAALIQHNPMAEYIEANNLVNGWISNYNNVCPDSDEYNEVKIFINNEYNEHIQS